METVLLIVHLLVAIALIVLVLLQQGKGADMGAAFGSGASSTVFGAQGSASFITRATAILATIFFITSLTLAYFSGQTKQDGSVIERTAPAPTEVPVPKKPAGAADVPTVPQGQQGGTVPQPQKETK